MHCDYMPCTFRVSRHMYREGGEGESGTWRHKQLCMDRARIVYCERKVYFEREIRWIFWVGFRNFE